MTNAVNLANIAANISGVSPLSLSGVNVTGSPAGGFTAMTATSVTSGGAKTTGWGAPFSTVGQNTNGIEVNNGLMVSRSLVPTSLNGSGRAWYMENTYLGCTPDYPTISYSLTLGNGGPSGYTQDLCYQGFSYGWLGGFLTMEIFERYYLNTGYRKYIYYSGYNPTFAEVTGAAFGRTDMTLSSTDIGQYNNGTTTPGTATDVTYWKKKLTITVPAYWGGYVRITTDYTPVTNLLSSYQIQLL